MHLGRPLSPTATRRLILLALVAAAALVVLQGCASNPEGWLAAPTAPPLPAYFVFVDREVPGQKCRAPGAWGCAERDFAAGVCRIYIERDAAPWQRTHELAHCAGYSHP